MSTLTGTSGNDSIAGTSGDDDISGLAGNDTIDAVAGDDTIHGGAGNDSLIGGTGDDSFLVAALEGSDDFNGGSGSDTISATADGMSLGVNSNTGVEVISAGGHTGVTLVSGAGVLNLTGVTLDGISTIDSGAGNDILVTGSGDETFLFSLTQLQGGSYDSIDAGGGNDVLKATVNNAFIGLLSLANVETITADGHTGVIIQLGSSGTLDFTSVNLVGITEILGSFGNDTITGSSANDTMDGTFGSDSLSGGAGDDVFFSATSVAGEFDAYDGGSGFDTIHPYGNNVAISIKSISGIEQITGDGYFGFSGTFPIIMGSGNDVLDLSNTNLLGIAYVDLGAGNDTVTSGLTNDNLQGNSGDDLFLLTATSGFDTVDGGTGSDTVSATADNMAISLISIANVEQVTAGGHTGVTVLGSSGNNTLNFSGATLTGIGSIDAGAGNDTVTGTSSSDVIYLSAGTDVFTGGSGGDTFKFALIGDSVAGAGRDRIADFAVGTDHLDLAAIDADTTTGGDQAFTFIGNGAFSHVAGQLRMDDSDPSKTIVYGDVNGDGVADFSVELTGHLALTSSDFFL